FYIWKHINRAKKSKSVFRTNGYHDFILLKKHKLSQIKRGYVVAFPVEFAVWRDMLSSCG
ncbi:MAG: hypothetical protein QGH26_04645, partial [Candidatus Pacebacteria bacterium]|nr:hypothetical protein [Candidatus Paceibacterota bacterium]